MKLTKIMHIFFQLISVHNDIMATCWASKLSHFGNIFFSAIASDVTYVRLVTKIPLVREKTLFRTKLKITMVHRDADIGNRYFTVIYTEDGTWLGLHIH